MSPLAPLSSPPSMESAFFICVGDLVRKYDAHCRETQWPVGPTKRDTGLPAPQRGSGPAHSSEVLSLPFSEGASPSCRGGGPGEEALPWVCE